MIFALYKYLMWFMMPLTILLIAVIGGGIYVLRQPGKWNRYVGGILLIAGLIGFVGSSPYLTYYLGPSLEMRYLVFPSNLAPKADAIVVLGGGVGGVTKNVPIPELYSGGDRCVHAARLYHAGKAPIIIPTGAGAKEQELPLLRSLLIPQDAIVLEAKSRDTEENARFTLELLKKRGAKKCLLVTSSWHLPRAMLLFKNDTIEIIPAGCDFESSMMVDRWDRMPMWQKLPSSDALNRNAALIKEYIALTFYRLFKGKGA